MPDTITVPQPLGFPAPFVALVDDQTKCYGNPVFLYEATSESAGSLSVVGYDGTSSCGVGYLYASCNHAHALAVVYPSTAQPHTTVSFGGTCWGLSGSLSDLRPYRAIAVSDVIPVASCADVACTGSDATGPSVLYMDAEEEAPVTVQFEHLDQGIPAYGVTPEAYSTGYSLSPPGRTQYSVWSARSYPLFRATESAQISVTIEPFNITRELVLIRNGQRSRGILGPGKQSQVVSAQAGDAYYLEFGNNWRRYRGQGGHVTWEKVVQVPRLYDTATMTFNGTQSITAVGFTGLTNRQDYAFYDALPASAQMDLPNPDTIVTVQDGGTLGEMELVRVQGVSEPDVTFSRPRYGGQKLASPVTFRFYAGRSRAGQHGEMDVWLDEDQSFPAYLKVSPYKVLAYGGYSYRKSASSEDTTRRGLRVVTEAEAEDLRLPRVYADDRGERISVQAREKYVFLNDQPYYFTGTVDAGISDTVYTGLEELGDPVHVRQYNVSGSPRGIAYVPATDEVWAATTNGIVIVAGAGTPGSTLVSSTPNYDIAWCAATNEVIVAKLDGSVVAYDPATRTPTKTGSIGGPSSYSVHLAVRGSTIYAGANMPNATLFGLRASDLVVAETYSTGSGVSVEGTILVSSTDQILLGTESGGCWLLDTSGSFVNVGVPSTTLWGFCDAASRRSFYAASASYPGAIREVDPATHAVLALMSTIRSARNPFWHPLRKKIYYGQYINGLEEIRDPNGNILSTVFVGEWSYATAYAPNHRLVFVTLPAMNAITVLT